MNPSKDDLHLPPSPHFTNSHAVVHSNLCQHAVYVRLRNHELMPPYPIGENWEDLSYLCLTTETVGAAQRLAGI